MLLRRRRARTAGTATASGIRPIGRRWTAELLPLLPRFLLTAPEYLPPKRQQSVFSGDNRKVETEYTVVEADRLKASHTPSYAQRSTEEYPAEIQGRAYHGSRGRQAREHTEQMVSNFDAERALDRTVSVAEGPAVVTPSGCRGCWQRSGDRSAETL